MAFVPVAAPVGALATRGCAALCARPSAFVSAPGQQRASAPRLAAGRPATRCSAAGDAGTTDAGPGALSRLVLPLSIVSWYAANIMFNLGNKKLLKMFPLFTTVTLFQFGMGSLAILTLWATRLHKFPRPTKKELLSIYPLAICHLLGNIFTNLSLRQMAVSFTHTIKASEPFFSVGIAKLFIPGTMYHPLVYLSLLPIVAGVTVASVTEASFNWVGFLTAMSSNISFQSRNVLSTKFMSDVTMDNLNLFGIISILSFLTLLPFTVALDGGAIAATLSMAADKGHTTRKVFQALVTCGFLHFLYNQFSYVVLQLVNNPVTHAVGNTMKRVAVIVSSVLVFKNPVSMQNWIGTGIAIAGVGFYSQVKKLKPKSKKKDE